VRARDRFRTTETDGPQRNGCTPRKQTMTDRIRKWIGIALLVLFGLAALAGGGTYVWFRYTVARSQPVVEGRATIAGLQQAVEILRDGYGIPHIYAQNAWDLYLAMGYAMAQDRLWQMEFYRRLGQGRLSELFGRETLELDRLFRTLAAAQGPAALPAEAAFIPRAFTAGINAELQQRGERLPLEFKLLGFRPEPWTERDYLAVLRVVQWGLSLGWKVDRTAARVRAKVGEDRFREAFPRPAAGEPITGSPDAALGNERPFPPDRIAAVRDAVPGFRPSPASNSWVVSGRRSESGLPILASDTHMQLSNPSLWWEVHLVCPPAINAAGFAIPGLPGLPVGHTLDVAWAVTNVMLDDVDFYIEKLHPRNPRQYRFEDRWLEMQVIEASIEIRDDEPEPLQIKLTRNGPLLREYENGGELRALSVRWSALELSPPALAAHRLLQAGNIREVISALRFWDTPAQNFIFADSAGNIGYWCCAAIPVRRGGGGMLPVHGWKAANRWQGFVPFEERPHRINPETGYIATANNPVTGEKAGNFIGNYWESADRIMRIRDRIEAVGTHSVESIRRIQADVYNRLAAELTPVVISAVENEAGPPRQPAALEILKRWDCRMEAGSAGALIFEAVYLQILEAVFRQRMGSELYRAYLETVVFPPRALRRILRSGTSSWLTTGAATDRHALDAVAAAGFQNAVSELRDRFGDDPESWQWGRVHTLTFTHVLAAQKPLGALFNLGPFPVAGNGLTPNKKSYDYRHPFRVVEGVSQRMIVDLADPLNARHVLPTGESGILHNAHYRDQIDLYLNHGDHRLAMERAAVESEQEARLLLTPRPPSGSKNRS